MAVPPGQWRGRSGCQVVVPLGGDDFHSITLSDAPCHPCHMEGLPLARSLKPSRQLTKPAAMAHLSFIYHRQAAETTDHISSHSRATDHINSSLQDVPVTLPQKTESPMTPGTETGGTSSSASGGPVVSGGPGGDSSWGSNNSSARPCSPVSQASRTIMQHAHMQHLMQVVSVGRQTSQA